RADVVRGAPLGGAGAQRVEDLDVRRRRPARGDVLQRGALVAHRGLGDDQVAELHPRLHRPAGAHPDQGMDAEVAELLDGDRRRRAADSGRGDADRHPVEGAGPGRELAVARDQLGGVEVGGDALATAGVAGEQHMGADVAGTELQVVAAAGAHVRLSDEPESVVERSRPSPSTRGSSCRMSGTSMTQSAAAAVSALTGQKATPSPARRNMSTSPPLSPTATTVSAGTPSAARVSRNAGSLPP